MSKKNNKGILCQIINSMWIGLTVVGMGWIGFLLVGKKGENKKWTRAGVFYAVAQCSLLFLIAILENGTLRTNIAIAWIILAFVTFVHAMIIRSDYINRRRRILTGISDENIKPAYIDKSDLKETEIEDEAEHIEDGWTLDVNCCAEKELVKLPGISVVQAKKAVEYREKNGGFSSMTEFYKVIDLKPHFVVQNKNHLVCTAYDDDNKEKAADTPDDKKGRILDI